MKTAKQLWASKQDKLKLMETIAQVVEQELDKAPVYPNLKFLAENPGIKRRLISVELDSERLQIAHLKFPARIELLENIASKLLHFGFEVDVIDDPQKGPVLKIATYET